MNIWLTVINNGADFYDKKDRKPPRKDKTLCSYKNCVEPRPINKNGKVMQYCTEHAKELNALYHKRSRQKREAKCERNS